MFQSIYDDIKREYTYGNMVTRIIIINVFMFILLNIAKFSFRLMGEAGSSADYIWFLKFFSLNADLKYLIFRPWTILTHMFLHDTGYHLIFNMLLFWWFGRIIGDLIGNRRVLPLYILSGLASAIFYLASFHLLKYGNNLGDYTLGSTGAVMGFILAATILSPNYKMKIILLGEVSIKYIAMLLVIIDFVSIAKEGTAGGHFSHLGGAIMGWIFISNLRSGNDMTTPIQKIIDTLKNISFKKKQIPIAKKTPRRPSLKVVHINEAIQKHDVNQERVDQILEKIKKSGYDNLTDSEKEDLFKASQNEE